MCRDDVISVNCSCNLIITAFVCVVMMLSIHEFVCVVMMSSSSSAILPIGLVFRMIYNYIYDHVCDESRV